MNVRRILLRTKVVSKDINSYCSNPGCRNKTTFKPRHNGHMIILEENGSVDIQEHINSFAPYCDLRYMLSRLKVGDMSVLASSPPTYGDFSEFPSDPAGLLNVISDVERKFSTLPDEVRQAHNNDWRAYFVSLFNRESGSTSDVQASNSSDKSVIKEVSSSES